MKNLSLLFLLWLPIALFSQGTTASAEPAVDAYQVVEREPSPVNLDEIKNNIGWPAGAKDIEGKVVVRVLVDETGKYVKHMVLKDPHPVLTKAVTDQLPLLKCTPAISNGKPIKFWFTLPFSFFRQD